MSMCCSADDVVVRPERLEVGDMFVLHDAFGDTLRNVGDNRVTD